MLNQSDYSDEFWYRAKHKSIRWDYWIATRYIHIYEAVLLSLDLDPERIYYPERRWALELNPDDRLSLDERVEIIEGYMGAGKLFDTDETFLNYKVDLRYFSQVLTDNFLPIPEILKKYAINPSDLVIAIKTEREEYLVDQDYLSKKAGVISGKAFLTTKELIRGELEDNRKKNYKETKYQYADEVKRLKDELAQAQELNAEIEKLKKQLQKENEQLRGRITELESQQNNITEPTGLNGIHAINQHKSDLQGMARVIASNKWADNDTVLIGIMADIVYREVAKYTTNMPETTDTVRNWIRPIAPVNAQKRGRPPNKN